MRPEVDQAAAAGQRAIGEPRLVRAVRVVEDEVDGVDVAELVADLPQRLHRTRVAVGEVHAEQPVRVAGAVQHAPRLGRVSGERLLAEHGDTALQGCHRLLRMKRAGGRDHNAVEVELEQLVEGLDRREAVRRLRAQPRVEVGYAGRLDGAAREHRPHPQAADPADAEEPDARTRRHGHASTSAFMKPSGRSAAA